MAIYTFEALDGAGKTKKGDLEADDRPSALATLKQRGLFPTKVTEKKGDKKKAATTAAFGDAPKKSKSFTFGGVGLKELCTFTRNLATLQEAGFPLVRTLKLLMEQCKPGVLKNALIDVIDDVEAGDTLSGAMVKHSRAFNNLYIGMLRAGEAGGVLTTILERLAVFMEQSHKLRKRVIGAMVYPCVVIVVTVVIVSCLMVFVIPSFKEMFVEMGIALPMVTELLITITDLGTEYWWVIFSLPAILIVVTRVVRKTPKGRYITDKLSFYIPAFGTIIFKSAISRFARTLGTLSSSGVSILEALDITRDATGNEVVGKEVDELISAIKEGESMEHCLANSDVFDPMMVNMLAVGEMTGELDKMLVKIADQLDLDVEVMVEQLNVVIEQGLILSMAGIVGFVVIALFLPLVNLIEKM